MWSHLLSFISLCLEAILTSSQDSHKSLDDSPIFDEDNDVDESQSPYKPPSEEDFSSDSDTSLDEEPECEKDPLQAWKVIVWVFCLMELFSVCRTPGCGQIVDENYIKKTFKGGALNVTATCNAGHTYKWCSSPVSGVGKYAIPLINTLIAAYTFTTGMHIDQIVSFFEHLRCACPGRTSMHNLSGDVIHKVVYKYWLNMRASLLQARKESSSPLHIGGDGTYDSPGFSARYCNYVVMDLSTKHILDFFTAIKFQVKGGSAAMEPFAAKTCLLSLLEYGVTITSFTTDRCSTIASMMEKDPRLAAIRHEYDVWHFVKCVMKDIFKVCKTKQ